LGYSSIASAVTPSGRAVVAWGTQDAGEGVERPWQVRAAVLRAGARRFTKAQLLDPGRVGRPISGVSAAITPGGTATVAWSGVVSGRRPFPVRVATAGSAGRFGATRQLAPNGAAMGVASARDGSTTVLWGSLAPDLHAMDDPYPEQLFAAHRAAGSPAFTSAEPVSPHAPSIAGGRLAIDPRSSRPAVLWTSGAYDDAAQTALYSTRNG